MTLKEVPILSIRLPPFLLSSIIPRFLPSSSYPTHIHLPPPTSLPQRRPTPQILPIDFLNEKLLTLKDVIHHLWALPTEDFCLQCLETSDQAWNRARPFFVNCYQASTRPPFPTSIAGTRYEYLALLYNLDTEFCIPTQDPEAYNGRIMAIIYNLNTEFVKAVRAHQDHYSRDAAGLEAFNESHAVSRIAQMVSRGRAPARAMYARATHLPRLRRGDCGWWIWRDAVRDFNRSVIKMIEELDEIDYEPSDDTCLRGWIWDFPVPLE